MMKIKDIKYFFHRKSYQIRRLIDFAPIIWKGYDWDYIYAIELFKHQLSRIEKHMSSDNAQLMNAGLYAKRLKTIIKLMDKVYDDEYVDGWSDELEGLYGKYEYVDVPVGNNGLSQMKKRWDNNYTKKELDKIEDHTTELIHKYNDKQKKAHRVLWKLIDHNIENFWD